MFCATCGAVQPPGAVDPFSRLGLTRGFAVDPKALDVAYFALQRRLHPDRFRSRSARERAIAETQSVAVNDAYEILRDPVNRAQWLLRAAGHRLDDSDGHTVHDPVLLHEALEDREALDDAGDATAIEALALDAQQRTDATLARLVAAFAAADARQAVTETLRMKYLRKLAEEARLKRRRLSLAA